MKTATIRISKHSFLITAVLVNLAWVISAPAGETQFTIPYVSGRPGAQPFAGHPGWVDIFQAGNSEGVGARVGKDAKFSSPSRPSKKPTCLIAMFDEIETPPVIVPNYDPGKDGDIPIPVEYACVPAGYPETWDSEYVQRGKDFV